MAKPGLQYNIPDEDYVCPLCKGYTTIKRVICDSCFEKVQKERIKCNCIRCRDKRGEHVIQWERDFEAGIV